MSCWDRQIELKEIIGKTITKITGKVGDNELRFDMSDGKAYLLHQHPDCCATVDVEDICGDLDDLIGSPILQAEATSSEGKNPEGVPVPEGQDSFTWTFYKFATDKGYVTIRWYGESNGYYSEEVYFCSAD